MTGKKRAKITSAPRKWGYARVSTDDQDLQAQITDLERYGVDGVFREKKSGKNTDRPEFQRMMSPAYLRGGDKIVVKKLDRLGRSLKDLIEIVEEIEARKAQLVSIDDNIDTSTATGRFFFHIIAAMAEWERAMIGERTKRGMQEAVEKGVKLGPKHSIADNALRLKAVRELDRDGKLRDEGGAQIMLDAELLVALNDADPKAKKIKNVATVRRWRREGYPGLDNG